MKKKHMRSDRATADVKKHREILILKRNTV